MEDGNSHKWHEYDRKFFDSLEDFTVIGDGGIGGKAHGLAQIKKALDQKYKGSPFHQIEVNIPRLTVISTSFFDLFLKQNNLYELAYSDSSDEIIAHHFQKADLPAILVGDIWALIRNVKTPLAIRSSSLLEDAKFEPFAGIYGTKMIPNNQQEPESRFRRLVEAIKFVYASTFFKEAKDYFKATNHRIEDEKMAVIIQEVVGLRHGDRFYPTISGVARSYNYYPIGKAKPEHGVVDLALGLGKAIVDGGMVWTYSPAYPRAKPPVGAARDLLKQSQNQFWAVNMGKSLTYDPMKETEYLISADLRDAESDDTLRFIASTFDIQSDRINVGLDGNGPRIINFAPILDLELLPLNRLIKEVLPLCENLAKAEVEIEFALTINSSSPVTARFGLLQVRPMVVSHEQVEIEDGELASESVIIASDRVMGNGSVRSIEDIVYVKPGVFDAKYTRQIAQEIEKRNTSLLQSKTPFLLIGFGRWGSSDPWLGIPVNWSQICGAKVIVEATLPNMRTELSQGSHFFHNLSSFQVNYFSVNHYGPYRINWDWLNHQDAINEGEFVRHIKTPGKLTVKVDGRTGKGIITI